MQVLVLFYIFIFVFILTIYKKNTDFNKGVASLFTLVSLSFYVAFISTRGLEHAGDTYTYVKIFTQFSEMNEIDFSSFRLERGFLFLTYILSKISNDEYFYLTAIASINAALWFFCFRIWFAPQKAMLAAFLFISLFFSYNLGGNVIRQGIALPLGLTGLWFCFKGKYTKAAFFFLLSVLFHKTTIILLAFYPLVKNKLSLKYYIFAFLVVSLFSISGALSNITFYILSSIGSYDYIFNEQSFSGYNTGFRVDFWLYTLIPLLLYYFTQKELRHKFEILMKLYLLLFSFFVVMFDIPYSDRVGVYCWSMFPLLLVNYIDNYKVSFLNDRIIFIIAIFVMGIASFLFYPVMDMSVKFSFIF